MQVVSSPLGSDLKAPRPQRPHLTLPLASPCFSVPAGQMQVKPAVALIPLVKEGTKPLSQAHCLCAGTTQMARPK